MKVYDLLHFISREMMHWTAIFTMNCSCDKKEDNITEKIKLSFFCTGFDFTQIFSIETGVFVSIQKKFNYYLSYSWLSYSSLSLSLSSFLVSIYIFNFSMFLSLLNLSFFLSFLLYLYLIFFIFIFTKSFIVSHTLVHPEISLYLRVYTLPLPNCPVLVSIGSCSSLSPPRLGKLSDLTRPVKCMV